MEFSNLMDMLSHRAYCQPNQQAYTYLQDGDTDEISITYQELHHQAKAIAAHLQSLVTTGERILLLYPSGLAFIAAFFGCLYAGMIAVPAYPFRRGQKKYRLKVLIENSQAKVALTTTAELFNMRGKLSQEPEFDQLHWLTTDDIDNEAELSWQKPEIDSGTLAFLQYTSGSTSHPKGVKISHGNLLHNSQLIYRCFEHSSQSRGVIWLPLYHDMGLIGGVIQPLYGGFPVTLMSPISFLKKPVRWLQAISRFNATTSGAPNFAYDLVRRRVTPEDLLGLDLSSWNVAFCGAEPICAQTLEKFANYFGSCGFRKEALYPCYGMAETTLLVSGGLKSQPPIVQSIETAALEKNQVVSTSQNAEGSKLIVGCGQSWSGQKVVIVNPELLAPCKPNQVGEIWVSGMSVSQGYWNQPEQTRQTFQNYLINEGPFLRTGDLGFLQDGELFVTGRIKDLMIIHGRNHYPHDIELTVEQCHPALNQCCGAAFVIEFGTQEQLVVVNEVERSHMRKLNSHEIVEAISQAIAEHHGLQVYAVLLLKIGGIPKTSSGKVQRTACREMFLTGKLEALANWSIDISRAA